MHDIGRRVGDLLDRLADVGSLCFWRRFHAALALVWFIQALTVPFTGLRGSVPYLIAVSLLTAFSGEMAGVHGVRAEAAAGGNDEGMGGA